jgi:regulator of protease activity HflC (stomatin/prohibitin superfamily)
MPRLIDYQSPGSPPQGYPLPARLIRRIAVPLASLLVVFVIVSNSYYTVDVGYVAVITRNGRIATVTTAGSGLGWMVPFISSVHKFSVQSQAVVYDQMQSYSLDQQPAYFKVSLRYHVSPGDVEDVYTQYGTEDSMVAKLLDRIVPQQVKTAFGQYTAVTAIAERGKMNAAVASSVESAITGPVVIEGVQLEDIKFSDAYENGVEQRMLAQVQVQKMEQDRDQQQVQAQITVIQAQAQADANVAQATAQAKATTLAGNATAAAIRARGDALRDNPNLVELTAAERWDGHLPTTMVPGSTLPFVTLPTGHN